MKALLKSQVEVKEKLSCMNVGAFFMEPGTGKTRPVVELTREQNPDYVLYVAPYRAININQHEKSIVYQVNLWGGFDCEHDFIGVESISASDNVYLELYNKMQKAANPVMIVDESLKIKNYEAKRTKRVINLGKFAKSKYILNGTPLSRNLLDLWSQMEFLSPKILKMGISEFKNNFCEYKKITTVKPGRYASRTKEWIIKYHNLDYLYKLIEPYIYESNLKLNINKQYIEINYCLSIAEKKEHETIIEKVLNDEWLMAKPNFFLELTQKLQNNYSRSKEKFAYLSEIINKQGGENIIVFAKFIKTQEELKRRFPEIKVLSYQKHSLGLNLQQYSVCVFFDKHWDYALKEQAERRIYRTGQSKKCIFYIFTANVGLEGMIDKNLLKKEDFLKEFKKLNIKQQLIQQMRKFNLNKAKEGFEVVTKKKVPVKILLFDRNNKQFPIVAIIDNKKVVCYTNEGKFYRDKDSENDLKMK